MLIPHVTWAESNDLEFLRRVANACPKTSVANVFCLGDELSAAETKWVISRCAAFAGARTHSTIAAISSAVPTLSLAYSRKARGLNQDVFGSQEFCLQPFEITPASVAERIANVLSHSMEIVKRLEACSREFERRLCRAAQFSAIWPEADDRFCNHASLQQGALHPKGA